jgi:hypothetical protein
VARARRELLSTGLDRLGQPERDPGDVAVLVAVGALAGWRPSSRTSTPPAAMVEVISAAACEMASIIASRAEGSSA